MTEARCDVCKEPCESVGKKRCDKCQAMDERLTYLIQHNEDAAVKYLDNKTGSLRRRGLSPPLIDKRKKQVLFSPLRRKADKKRLWSHTPERRMEQREPSQKRRKSNGVAGLRHGR